MHVNQTPLEHIASKFLSLSKTGDVESTFFASCLPFLIIN